MQNRDSVDSLRYVGGMNRDYIRKRGGKFVVVSHSGKTLGTHSTRAEALKQLRAVEYHKAHDAPARMGSLELSSEMPFGHGEDGFSPKESNLENQLQPHELPERRSNPYHASDPLLYGPDETLEEGERYLKVEEPAGGPAIDAIAPKESNVENQLQPHELPERRSNAHHAPDPLNHGPDKSLEEGERYLTVEEPLGHPAVDMSGSPGGNDIYAPHFASENLTTARARANAGMFAEGPQNNEQPAQLPMDDRLRDPMGSEGEDYDEDIYDVSEETLAWRAKQKPGSIMHPKTFKAIKRAAAKAGARDPEAVAGAAYWATVKAKHKAAKDAESRVPQEEDRAPFEPGGNGDPSPNPSKMQTIGATNSISIAGGANESQPDEYALIDEGDPNQYEMLSTARKAPDLNEANEPNYFEYVPPSSGPDDRKQGWKDPSGDDDWLKTVGAIPASPNTGGSEL